MVPRQFHAGRLAILVLLAAIAVPVVMGSAVAAPASTALAATTSALTPAPVIRSAPAARPAPGAALRVSKLSFTIGHRVFTEFRDQVSVKLHESFRAGDSEYSAKAVEFQPDFTMDLKSRKVTSRSSEPRNPAVRVIVWKNGVPQDTSWAFLNMPPHYARNSMLAFRLTHVEFENHAAIDAPKDSTVTARAGGAKP
jgi:hypothetical protein